MRPPRWLERLVLRGFEPEEIEDIRSDLEELSADRSEPSRTVYYWAQLLRYPWRRVGDAARHRGADRPRVGRAGFEGLARDLRHALRGLLRKPGFAVMTTAILTIGMGAGAAVFSVVDGVLLDPLPIERPERIVSLWMQGEDGRRGRMTPGHFMETVALEGVFRSTGAFQGQTSSLMLDGEPRFLRGSAVTPGYFDALGVQPLLGRALLPEEGESGGESVVVLSHHVWQQAFGADPGIVGRSIRLDGGDFTVVGVMPPGVYPTQATVSAEIPFTASNQDFFVPMRYSTAGWQNYRSHLLGTIGRLADGVDPAVAEARLAALSDRLSRTLTVNQSERLLMTSFTEEVVGDVRFALLLLLATVVLVLSISVVNVAALFVLRAGDRIGELGLRVALGAPLARLVRSMLLESTVIAVVASLGAMGVARVGLAGMRALVPYQIPRLAEVGVGPSVFAVTFAVGGAVALLLGVAPALRLRSGVVPQGLGQGRHTQGRRRRTLQGLVVGLQAALCVVVLVGAGLLARSYATLRAVDTGFSATGTWAMTIPAPLATLELVAEELRGRPGIERVAIAYDHPLERNWGDGFTVEGAVPSPSDPPGSGSLRPFGAGYFETVGIEVVEGRVPDRLDMDGPVPYAVINETLASIHFPDRSPLGERLVVGTAQRMLGTDGAFEILGVVRDVRFLGPDQDAGPAFYLPLSHFPVGASTLLVRPGSEDLDVPSTVRAAAAAVDPTLGVQEAQLLGTILDDLLARPRFNMMLLVSFGVIGLVLCGLGAYGLVARVVASQIREIGIRMALGADRTRLARSVLGTAVRPILLGGAAGLALALVGTGLMRSLLFGVSPTDPAAFAGSLSFVLVVGVVAALAPTVRAVRVAPSATLREE